MTQRHPEDPKLQARVRALKARAKQMAKVKERPFMEVLERWLEVTPTHKEKGER